MSNGTSDARTALRVTMVSPHLPPEQGANAILPALLAPALASNGVATRFVAHPPRQGGTVGRSLRVDYVPRRGRRWLDRSVIGAALAGARIAGGAAGAIRGSELVHLHSNGLIVEVSDRLASLYEKPSIITLYGTDIWDHDPRRHARFAGVVRRAACRVFYSRLLLEYARARNLAPEPSVVIYAPVPPLFRSPAASERSALRQELGLNGGLVLLTVKRLHPVAGHEDLLRAMPSILNASPDTQLLLVGEGELRGSLERLAQEMGVARHVRFLGSVPNDELWRYYAGADLFVLPSRLESWGTVMLESLACGTPVVATETAGGCEVRQHFSDDVRLVECERPESLAEAVSAELRASRRSSDATRRKLAMDFSVAACARQYLEVYLSAVPDSTRAAGSLHS